MAAGKSTEPSRIPKVRIARPKGRPYQIRYTDPDTNKEIRISVGSRDEKAAQRLHDETVAKLTLGLGTAPRERVRGPSMRWEHFREDYSRLKLSTLRTSTAESTENRLDVCQRILRPRTLADLTKPGKFERLKAELLAGTASRLNKPRSAHTTNSYLAALVAALNWAHTQGYLEECTRRQVVAADDPDKGRPLTTEEFERMLAAVPAICPGHEPGWIYLLRGLWESGLRVDEAMHLSFDLPKTITVQRDRRGVMLAFPGARQKNRKAQTVPTTPAFAALLDEHPTQTGMVFTPTKRNGRSGRPTTDQVGKVISAIGAKALIRVNDAGKFASAHDLRRSFGQRLADAGVGPRDLQKIMRHRSITTTEAYYLRDDAGAIGDRIAARLMGTGVPSSRE